MSSSLELDGAEGVGGAELRVLADGPLLRQAVILGQTLRLVILTGRDARGQAHMLTYQAAAAAPAGDGGGEWVMVGRGRGRTMRCQVNAVNAAGVATAQARDTAAARHLTKKRGDGMERLRGRRRDARRPELPWQLVI